MHGLSARSLKRSGVTHDHTAGFFRKELIIVMVTQALGVQTIAQLPLSFEQIIVFVIFVT